MGSGSKAVLIGIIFLLVLGGSIAYDGGSGATTVQEVECNDNEDNDGDGLVDEEDPGCTEPYSEDNSEGNLYDPDFSWVASGWSEPTTNGPSIFLRSTVVNTDDSRSNTSDRLIAAAGPGEMEEVYVEGSKDWGGGFLRQKNFQDSNFIINEQDGEAEVIDRPNYFECGNLRREKSSFLSEYEENNFNCPEDFGFPDDMGTTYSTSKQDISKTLKDDYGSEWTADNLVDIGDSHNSANSGRYLNDKENNDDIDDEIIYDPVYVFGGQFIASEAEGTKTDDITSDNTIDRVIQDKKWKNIPDFFIKDDTEIWMVYPVKTGEEYMGTVTDYDTTNVKSFDKYGSVGSYDGLCSGSNENATCTSSSGYCTGIDHGQATIYELEEETDTVPDSGPVSTNIYTTESDGDKGHEKVEEDTDGLKVEVTHNPDVVPETVDDDSCDYGSLSDGCEITDSGGDCTMDGSATKYGSVNTKTGPTEWHTHDVSYYHETLGLREKKIIDLNPVEDVSGNELVEPIRALFEGDNYNYDKILRNSHQGRAYWSKEINPDDRDISNDPAVSVSRFQVNISDSDNDFVSYRDHYNVYDADGNGFESVNQLEPTSDGYVSILHKKGDIQGSGTEITGWTEDFLQHGKINSVENGGNNEISNRNFLDPSAIDEPGCAGEYVTCIGVVDVSTKNLDKWPDPTNPRQDAVEIEFEKSDNLDGTPDTYNTSRSLGVCELFQRLDDQYPLLSRYTYDTDSPSSENARCINDQSKSGSSAPYGPSDPPPDDPPDRPCGEYPCPPSGDWNVHMEGPAVDHDEIRAAHSQIVTIGSNFCNIKGLQVPEGWVGNIETQDQEYSYEDSGRSPDREICLDINNGQIDGIGDFITDDNIDFNRDGTVEDLGGEWYNMDNPVVNEYLRNQGSFLIDNSNWADPDDPNNVAYYYRKNNNPQHPDYNPAGGEEGVALEDDCGPGVSCDFSRNPESEDLFQNFFLRGAYS